MWADASGKISAADYQGGRTAKEIVQWGVQQAQRVALGRLGVQAGGGGGARGGGGGGGSCGGGGGGGHAAGGDFYAGTHVVSLSDEDFHKQVIDSDDLWFVEVRDQCLLHLLLRMLQVSAPWSRREFCRR